MYRKEVLRCYKSLLRTRANVFAGDYEALRITHEKAREAFEKNRDQTNPEEIKKLVKIGWDAKEILQQTVIQAKLNSKGNYEAEIKRHHLDPN
ncbi:hypothetical protein RDWZM_006427 [Blomia tropicalis]|uniref:Complex III assembly factor LYRM7 n=1 Tax=Blomia tropicalis TaxID=40697 RepID=A0A9Q0RNJ7_BLOTA|nr:hypothetical protein BLOT_008653 [Blomia tropicalis]KAJ6220615.1 hypothetical protein RDWZM_006427 [Blomia tropicalis]